QAFTIMDQNRDGFIDKNDLRDTFAALGASHPPQVLHRNTESPHIFYFSSKIMFPCVLFSGADPEETILNAFKVFDPEGKGVLKA
uniref:EF-hand domain-containing protein n=1 Tax=Loxodonta africana TaxID=9785 RepID=G3UCA4_LOXAF